MKQGSFKVLSFTVSFILLAGMAVFSAFGESTVSLESVVIESFGTTFHEWSSGNRGVSNANFSWKLDASRFTTRYGEDLYPKMTFVPSWPMALYGVNREGRDIQSLGIWGRFDRRGYNWIDIYPVVGDTEEPYAIPMPGRLTSIDMWVWGSNMNLSLEAYFRDYRGIVHIIPLGNLNYTGWRNLSGRIPAHIPQSRRIHPTMASLEFLKFRIWTTPLEQVNDFFVYFNNFKILTNTFVNLFDGDELADPVVVQEFWTTN